MIHSNTRLVIVKRAACVLGFLALTAANLSCAPSVQVTEAPSSTTLVWSDEFNGAAGSAVDARIWSHDLGDGCKEGICGWGNQEKETYTSALDNVALDGQGHLAITARRATTSATCYYGPCRYSSAKIKTQGKAQAPPGRVEARIKLPEGQGLWPAFWMLGSNFPLTPWPASGELDIMENHGSAPNETSSAIHGPGYSGKTPFARGKTLPTGKYSDDFHVFAIEWDTDAVRFFVDSTVHYTIPKSDVGRYGAWVFDQPFFVILNLAVGGLFDGDPLSDAILPATMLVDYVRVYARSPRAK